MPVHGRSNTSLVGAALLLMSACPFMAVATEPTACAMEVDAARAMLAARDAGQSRDFLLRPLGRNDAPFVARRDSLQARLTESLRHIVQDIYAHPEVHADTYRMYRKRRCLLGKAGHPVPADLGQVSAPLMACQAQHAAANASALAACIDAVLDGYPAPT